MKTLARLGTFLLLLLTPVTRAGQDDSEVVRGETGARLDEYLTRLEGVGFSGVVGVMKGDEPLLLKGYGLADREAGKPVTTDTVFTVGSITKQFTAAAIMLLEDREELSVEDSITKYFADVPADKKGITLHHLLTHTSGLAGGFGSDWDLEATDEWVLARALASKLRWAPGGGFQYSNAGYSLLGMIVERVSGRGYEDFLRTELFEPAGMTTTGYTGFAPGAVSIGYDQGKRWGTVLDRPMLPDGPCWNLRANGGIHSTVHDMLRWHQALEGDELLSAAAKAKMFTGYADEGGGRTFYGYGWSIRDVPDEPKIIAHNGGNGILFADFLRYPDDDLVIFMATNVAQDFAPMTRPVRAVVFDQSYSLPPATLEVTDSFAGRYTGEYVLDDESAFALEVQNGRVLLVGHGLGAAEILGAGDAEREVSAWTTEVVEGLLTGEHAAFHARNDGERPRQETDVQLARFREDLVAANGPFEGLGRAAVRVEGDGARCYVTAHFEEGAVYVILGWDGERIGMLDAAAEPPWPAGGELQLFPFSPTEFGTFSMRGDPERTVRFELDDEGNALLLELDAELGPIQAYRD